MAEERIVRKTVLERLAVCDKRRIVPQDEILAREAAQSVMRGDDPKFEKLVRNIVAAIQASKEPSVEHQVLHWKHDLAAMRALLEMAGDDPIMKPQFEQRIAERERQIADAENRR